MNLGRKRFWYILWQRGRIKSESATKAHLLLPLLKQVFIGTFSNFIQMLSNQLLSFNLLSVLPVSAWIYVSIQVPCFCRGQKSFHPQYVIKVGVISHMHGGKGIQTLCKSSTQFHQHTMSSPPKQLVLTILLSVKWRCKLSTSFGR